MPTYVESTPKQIDPKARETKLYLGIELSSPNGYHFFLDRMDQWTVVFHPSTVPYSDSKKTSELIPLRKSEDALKSFQSFKRKIATHFGLQAPKILLEDAALPIDENNISERYSTTNSTLYVQLKNENRVLYPKTISTVPSTAFKRNQTILYTPTSAICEFLDNSIQYTQKNEPTEGRLLQISVKPYKDGERMLCIDDNGIGMNAINMNRFVTLAAKGFTEDAETSANYVCDSPREPTILYSCKEVLKEIQKYHQFFSSFLSKWGTGAKLALDSLGREQSVSSTVAGSNIEIIYNLERKNKDWTVTSSERIVEESKIQSHYTRIAIYGLDDIGDEGKIISELSKIYYFYCNGFVPFLMKIYTLAAQHTMMKNCLGISGIPNEFPLFPTISLKYNELNLGNEWIDCLENAKSVFPISFSFTLAPPNVNTVSGSKSLYFLHVAHVYVFYFPYENGEKFPTGSPQSEYYWLGRLLPGETGNLPFMNAENSTSEFIRYFSRLKAVIFLNRAFTPTPEKQRLLDKEDGKNRLLEEASSPQLLRKVHDWIKDCHLLFDKEFTYSKFLSTKSISINCDLHAYGTLQVENSSRLVNQGDFVRLTPKAKKNPSKQTPTKQTRNLPARSVCGRIIHFQYEGSAYSTKKKKQRIAIRPFTFQLLEKEELLETELFEIEQFKEDEALLMMEELKAQNEPGEIIVSLGTGKNPVKEVETSTDKSVKLLLAVKPRIGPNKLSCNNFEIECEWLPKEGMQYPVKKQIVPAHQKRFTFDVNTRLMSGQHTLRFHLICEKKRLPIQTKFVINVQQAKEKELNLLDYNDSAVIQLGEPFTLPSISLLDVADIPFSWSELAGKSEYPKCSLLGDSFITKKPILCNQVAGDHTKMSWKDCILEPKSLESVFHKEELVTFSFSFRGIEKTASFRLIGGAVKHWNIKGSTKIENWKPNKLRVTFADYWNNPTSTAEITEDVIGFVPTKDEIENHVRPPPAFYYASQYADVSYPDIFAVNSTDNQLISSLGCNYRMKSDLYSPGLRLHPRDDKKVKPVGKQIISDDGPIYQAISVDGIIFQSGDYFALTENVFKDAKGNFGMFLYALYKKDELYIHLLYVGKPNCQEKKYHKFFAGRSWGERELCLSNYHMGCKASAAILHRVHILSKVQYEKEASRFGDNVYFTNCVVNYTKMDSILKEKTSARDDADSCFLPLKGKGTDNEISFLIIGEPNNEILCLDGMDQEADLRSIEQQAMGNIIGKHFFSSAFLWTCNGKPLSLPLSLSDIPSGSTICRLPYRGCILDDSNETLTLTLNHESSTQFLTSHQRLEILPSTTPCCIQLSIDDSDVNIDDYIIKGVRGREFTMAWEVVSDFNISCTEEPTSIQMIQPDNDPIYIESTEKEFRFQMPSSAELVQWTLEIAYGPTIVKKILIVEPVTGKPYSMRIIKLKRPGKDWRDITDQSINMKCGEFYNFEMQLCDQKGYVLDASSWKDQNITLDANSDTEDDLEDVSQQKVSVKLFGGSKSSSRIRNIRERKLDGSASIFCDIAIDASCHGVDYFCVAAQIERKKSSVRPLSPYDQLTILSQNLSVVICPGVGSALQSAVPEITEAETYETICFKLEIVDRCGNTVENERKRKITMNYAGAHLPTEEEDMVFKYVDGVYIKELTFTQHGMYQLIASPKNTRKSSGELDEYHFPSLNITQTTEAAADIIVKNYKEYITAGETFEVKCVAVTKHGVELPDIQVFPSLRGDASIAQALTKVGKYQFEAVLDKAHTADGTNDLIITKSFEVFPGDPGAFSFSKPITTDAVLRSAEDWVWQGRIKIGLEDDYGNPCQDYDENQFILIEIVKEGESVPVKQWREPLRQGTIDLLHAKFSNLPLHGAYALILSFSFKVDRQTETLVKKIHFSTIVSEAVEEKRKAEREKKINAELLQLKERIKRCKSRTEYRNYQDCKVKYHDLEQRLNELNTASVFDIRMENGPYHAMTKRILSMKCIQRNYQDILGPICSLACVGGNILQSRFHNSFNVELTAWIGGDVSTVVVHCHNDPGKESHLIAKIKREQNQSKDCGNLKLKILNRDAGGPKAQPNGQKLIQLEQQRIPGFMGYAVNLLFLDARHLALNLRSTLWYPMLKRVMVFETSDHLFACYEKVAVKASFFAFSLDGSQQRGHSFNLLARNQNRDKKGAFRLPSVDHRDEIRSEMAVLSSELAQGMKITDELTKMQDQVKNLKQQLNPSRESISRDPRLSNSSSDIAHSPSVSRDPRLSNSTSETSLGKRTDPPRGSRPRPKRGRL